MRPLISLSLVVLMFTIVTASAMGQASGPGNVIVGSDASVWDSDFGDLSELSVPLIPIGGSGQVNGEFTIVEHSGVQIGLRAQERFFGTLPAMPNNNGQVGIYEAETGFSGGTAAKWNYD